MPMHNIEEMTELAQEVLDLIQQESDYESCEVLRNYANKYQCFIELAQTRDVSKLLGCLNTLRGLARAYLEVNSDWGKPFLSKMYEFEQYAAIYRDIYSKR